MDVDGDGRSEFAVFGGGAFHVFHANVRIKRAFRVYDYNRACGAKAEATGADNLHFFVQTVFHNLFFKALDNFAGTRRSTAGAAAA